MIALCEPGDAEMVVTHFGRGEDVVPLLRRFHKWFVHFNRSGIELCVFLAAHLEGHGITRLFR